ncbi:MAG TPA: hypothetical protein VEA99_04705 [Gemmatimonadaceae bacterium]|nr:hypothetical protein [Gemmatimonadaceae bacterium]
MWSCLDVVIAIVVAVWLLDQEHRRPAAWGPTLVVDESGRDDPAQLARRVREIVPPAAGAVVRLPRRPPPDRWPA